MNEIPACLEDLPPQECENMFSRKSWSRGVTLTASECNTNLDDIRSPLEITAYMTRMTFFIQMLGVISCKSCVGVMRGIVSSIGVTIVLGVMGLLLVCRLSSVQPIQLKRHCD